MGVFPNNSNINITVAIPGISGPRGPQGPSGNSGTGVFDPSGYLTSGDADNRYYFSNNPSGYLTNLSGIPNDIINTGNLLNNIINLLSGFITSNYYLNTNPAGYLDTLSGVPTNLETTGINLLTRINNTGQGLSTRIQSSGSNLSAWINLLSGYIVANINTVNSNLTNTGLYMNNLYTSLSNALAGNTTILNNEIVALSGNLIDTGAYLYNIINTSPRLYIGSGSPEGVIPAPSGSVYSDWFGRRLYQKITGLSTIGWI